jgi:hypothetical protein
MKTAFVLPLIFAATVAFGADQSADPQLARTLAGVPVTLEQGIMTSAAEGKPISAKYELEVDGLQLSIYTMNGDSFKEVIVDHRSGRIAKVIPITDRGDLGEATEQRDIMLHAKRSLQDAAAEAVARHSGYRAVSAMPGSEGRRLVASVLLTNGNEWKTVNVPLDLGD